MTLFSEQIKELDWEKVSQKIYGTTAEQVEQSLSKERCNLDDFLHFLSPAAAQFLEPMAAKAKALTQKRFGKTIQLFAPLYLSNECHNICTYCGFSQNNDIPRKTLSPEEIDAEIAVLKGMGFDHVLIVTGEAKATVGVPYLKKAIAQLRPHFSQISLEVQPLEQEEYFELREEGLSAVYVYQETYHKAEYKKHHPKGKKSIFDYRVNTPDRLGKAGIPKIGIGALLGLEDWRIDTFFCGAHLDYLEKTYWQSKYSIAFPRLRPNAGGLEPKVVINDREMVQLICAWRLFKEEIELSLSTRESPAFREGVMPLGVTTMSAGSKTDPGGYAQPEAENLEQFSISDERSPAEVAVRIEELGYQPVWKDWDLSYDLP